MGYQDYIGDDEKCGCSSCTPDAPPLQLAGQGKRLVPQPSTALVEDDAEGRVKQTKRKKKGLRGGRKVKAKKEAAKNMG